MLVHMIVSGRVQGVSFRYSVQQQAIELGLTGWAENKIDGTVEIEVEGKEEIIEKFISMIRKGFHRFMQVEHVELYKSNDKKGYLDFKIR